MSRWIQVCVRQGGVGEDVGKARETEVRMEARLQAIDCGACRRNHRRKRVQDSMQFAVVRAIRRERRRG